ncbi:MAG: hypothetical protein Q4G69_12480 [Planctomycetia bacterium]|nr:hypothetical protein [Planctomycetia bacterium]
MMKTTLLSLLLCTLGISFLICDQPVWAKETGDPGDYYMEALEALEVGDHYEHRKLLKKAAMAGHTLATYDYGEWMYIDAMGKNDLRGMQAGLKGCQKGLKMLKKEADEFDDELYRETYKRCLKNYKERCFMLNELIVIQKSLSY